MSGLDDRRVLLVVTAGIAAYKCGYLVREMLRRGAEVDVVMTPRAENFVGRATFEGLTGRRLEEDIWDRPMAHLELGRDVDAVVVAPATADFLARMAGGRADDLASTAVLAADGPVLVAPAMNTRMWENAATRDNVAVLEDRGVTVVGPDSGELAEREVGPGRMAEPDTIVAETERMAFRAACGGGPLDGEKIVVTAGPTRAHVDPVRFLTNRSSGRMGYGVAAAAWRRGAEVSLITGPGTVEPPHGPAVTEVETAGEMLDALHRELAGSRALVMSAAVSDFRPTAPETSKIKRGGRESLTLELEPGPDLLAETRQAREEGGIFTVGFALETDDARENARRKLEEKGLQIVALNEVGEETGLETPTNRVTLLEDDGTTEEWPLLSKDEAGERLVRRIAERLEE